MLKIENISKTFNPGTINEKAALQGLSLHLQIQYDPCDEKSLKLPCRCGTGTNWNENGSRTIFRFLVL